MKNVYITSFFLLSATVFVGGCALTQKSNPMLTPTVSSTGESVENTTTSSTANEVDTSTWKMYRNEELGFEMKVPVEWGEPVFLSKTDASDSRNFPFWMREIDGLSFRNDHIDIMFASEYSSSTVGTYAKRFGLERGRERVVNGMLAYEEITKEVIPTSVGNEVHSVADAVVVRGKDRGYFFDARVFSEDEQEIDRLIAEWFVALGTFRSLK